MRRGATDDGEPNGQQGEYEPTTKQPELDLSGITGDWRALPSGIMYQIRELPILEKEAGPYIAAVNEHDSPPEYKHTFRARQYQYTRLGLKAVILSRRLRKLVLTLPETRLDATEWSAQPVLWRVWRRERKQRAKDHLISLREDIMLQIPSEQK